ncbi:MAG: single-strand selective monofunctional uracil-DNA glycosylase [bacterium]|nr:single-strand selective monofunctional uracil-DNA glycosylase [bacterium]
MRRITERLVRDLKPLRFEPPVAYVYNPLTYAAATYHRYLELFGGGTREVILLGMNPGPWGMAQTGVPFGEVNAVRDWLGIEAPIGKPRREHPRRPVLGLDCPRSEVSGARLWTWAQDHCKTPKVFFRRFFVANYCPLAFLEESGRNRTPDKLPADERTPLLEACDRALRRTVEHFRARQVIGIGAYAERQAITALRGMDVSVGRILHPSPASPAANRGWADQATAQLAAQGIRFDRRVKRPISVHT